jgi:hypothetical protein
MKIIITESQQEYMRTMLNQILPEKFVKNSGMICDIKIYEVDEDEKDYEVERGLKYDIYVHLTRSIIKFPDLGQQGIKAGIRKKLDTFLQDWMGLDSEEYYIGFLLKDCDKKI